MGKEGARNWLENFWSNTEKRDTNPTLILAQILAEQGLGVSISDNATRKNGGPVPDCVAICATPEGRMILERAGKTPQILALKGAYRLDSFHLTQVINFCSWDEQTKRRVEAFYWLNRFAFWQKAADEILAGISKRHKEVKEERETRAEEAKNKAEELLGSLKPLTPDDIRALIGEVVDRVLAQPAESA